MEDNTRVHCLICPSTRVVLVGFGYHSQTSIRLGGEGPLRFRFRCTCVPQEYLESMREGFPHMRLQIRSHAVLER